MANAVFSFYPNPLFEREWRGRWRRLSSHGQLALLVVGAAAVLCFLVARRQFRDGQIALLSIQTVQERGLLILSGYQICGGALLAIAALLIGIVAFTGEKDAGTYEQLLLCPLGPRGIIGGKIWSGAAFLLVLQLGLLPMLMGVSALCLVPPKTALGIGVSHFLLTVQALALGLWAATQSRTIAESIARAGGVAICLAVGLAATLFFGAMLIGLAWIILSTFVSPLKALNPVLAPLVSFFGPIIVSFAGGLSGILALLPPDLFGSNLKVWPVFLGQIAGIYFLLRWTALQLRHPERQLLTGNVMPYRAIFLGRDWELSAWNLADWPLVQEPKPFWTRPPRVQNPKNGKPNSHAKRLRLVSLRWAQNLNPVFKLDVQRCLSLRTSTPESHLFLMLFLALGGSICLALGMATAVSLFQRVLTGSRADLSWMRNSYADLRVGLCYLALASGPLFAALGYVIERRSFMLHELRLTLLGTWAIWWGKFAARWIIPLFAALPGLAIVGFFADNLPETDLVSALISQSALILTVAACSVLVCLAISFHARNELTAWLWCLTWSIGWGVLWRIGPPIFSAHKAVLGGPLLLGFLVIHGILAIVCGGYLFWRLRREGFG